MPFSVTSYFLSKLYFCFQNSKVPKDTLLKEETKQTYGFFKHTHEQQAPLHLDTKHGHTGELLPTRKWDSTWRLWESHTFICWFQNMPSDCSDGLKTSLNQRKVHMLTCEDMKRCCRLQVWTRWSPISSATFRTWTFLLQCFKCSTCFPVSSL